MPSMENSVAKAEKKQETTVEFLASLASVLVVGLFIIAFILQAFEIPSGSMENTLLIGDHIFVDRVGLAPKTNWFPLLPYRDIKRGDVVVFFAPAQPGLHLVKRIIGIPGDRIHLVNGMVYRNGQKLDEPYVIHSVPGIYNPYAQNFPAVPASEGSGIFIDWQLTMQSHIDHGDIVVPAESYFAMGDNRDISEDSRYWGFVPQENVIGRPLLIYWSFKESETQYEQKEISQRMAFFLHTILHFFDGTRWRRMLRVVH